MKVLLIGSSFSAMPFLFHLQHIGADVTVIGKYDGDPCHSFVEKSIYEDYSDSETLLTICRDRNFDYIVPSCNDYSYVAGSAVANILGLPGFDNPEVTLILHTKDRFRQFCLDIGVPSPRIYGEIADEADIEAVAVQLDGGRVDRGRIRTARGGGSRDGHVPQQTCGGGALCQWRSS
jgi:hypothetical protein